ncbi:MAG: hypothetical protein JNM56_02750 [Planctomycetia bacterium]|nr:hypothetical protein [Planctomycetia bacterium]
MIKIETTDQQLMLSFRSSRRTVVFPLLGSAFCLLISGVSILFFVSELFGESKVDTLIGSLCFATGWLAGLGIFACVSILFLFAIETVRISAVDITFSYVIFGCMINQATIPLARASLFRVHAGWIPTNVDQKGWYWHPFGFHYEMLAVNGDDFTYHFGIGLARTEAEQIVETVHRMFPALG